MHILHIGTGVGKGAFGLGSVALNLAKEQLAQGEESRIWCFGTDDDVKWGAHSSGYREDRIFRFPLAGPRALWWSPAMERAAAGDPGRAIEIVHQHGIWTGASRATNLLRRRYAVPTVIASHGHLDSWALGLSRWKKKVALAAYERQNLANASCLHATSPAEIADFRNFGLKNPIALIPNGISSLQLREKGDPLRFRARFSLPADKRILLFLSRITPKKGLMMLLDAIKNVEGEWQDWMLLIAGTDEFGHQAEVEARISALGLDDTAKIIGPLFDAAKADAFAAADLFVLPSFSEGAPMVILDSLAAGVPVIATQASPWEDLVRFGCGWWVPTNTEGLAAALGESAAMDQAGLGEKGRRGRDLVASSFTWASLAKHSLDLYRWLLGRGDKPDFVLTD